MEPHCSEVGAGFGEKRCAKVDNPDHEQEGEEKEVGDHSSGPRLRAWC